MTPRVALKRVQNEMIPYFPLGVYRDWESRGKKEDDVKVAIEA